MQPNNGHKAAPRPPPPQPAPPRNAGRPRNPAPPRDVSKAPVPPPPPPQPQQRAPPRKRPSTSGNVNDSKRAKLPPPAPNRKGGAQDTEAAWAFLKSTNQASSSSSAAFFPGTTNSGKGGGPASTSKSSSSSSSSGFPFTAQARTGDYTKGSSSKGLGSFGKAKAAATAGGPPLPASAKGPARPAAAKGGKRNGKNYVGNGSGGTALFFASTRNQAEAQAPPSSSASSSSSSSAQGRNSKNAGSGSSAVAGHEGFDPFEFMRQQSRGTQEFSEHTFWFRILQTDITGMANEQLAGGQMSNRRGTTRNSFISIPDGPDLLDKPSAFTNWRQYRSYWGHFLASEARAQIQQMVGECAVSKNSKAATWHKAKIKKDMQPGSMQVQMLEQVGARGLSGLVATQNAVVALRSSTSGRLLLVRPTRALSYDVEGQWTTCGVDEQRWQEFGETKELARVELCAFGHTSNLISVFRELQAVLNAEQQLQELPATAHLADHQKLSGDTKKTKLGPLILTGKEDAEKKQKKDAAKVEKEKAWKAAKHLERCDIMNYSNCNPSQQEVVKESDLREDGIMLVHGPPGTGKSTTVVWVLNTVFLRDLHLWFFGVQEKIFGDKNFDNTMDSLLHVFDSAPGRFPRLLVTAPSNQAVDEIYKKVAVFQLPTGPTWKPTKYRLLSSQFRSEDIQQRVRSWMATKKDEIPQVKKKVQMEHRGKISKAEKLITQIKKLCEKCPKTMQAGWEVVWNEGAGGQVAYRQGPPNNGWQPFWNPPFETDWQKAMHLPHMKQARMLMNELMFCMSYDVRAYRQDLRRAEFMEKNFEHFPMVQPPNTGTSNKGVVNKQRKPAAHMRIQTYFENHISEGMDIVFATLNQSQAVDVSVPCSTVIVDEACQATETSTLIPIVASRCRAAVLVGDPNQLPATTLNPELTVETLLEREEEKSKSTTSNTKSRPGTTGSSSSEESKKSVPSFSLFERLQKNGMQPHLLDTQYRMHPLISEFPSQEFYQGRLKDDPMYDNLKYVIKDDLENFHVLDSSELCGQMMDSGSGSNSCNRTNIYSTTGTSSTATGEERALGTSWKNEAEAQVIEALVEFLQRAQPWMEILVISPYLGQVHRLKRLEKNKQNTGFTLRDHMEKKFAPGTAAVAVNTIDSCQGSQSFCVIFNLVRANGMGELGFLEKDFRRFNVALTRAQRHLFVVGNLDTIRKTRSEFWQRWLRHVESNRFVSRLSAQVVKTFSSGRKIASSDLQQNFEKRLYRRCAECEAKHVLLNIRSRKDDGVTRDAFCAQCRAVGVADRVRQAQELRKRCDMTNKLLNYDESFEFDVKFNPSTMRPLPVKEAEERENAEKLIDLWCEKAGEAENSEAGEGVAANKLDNVKIDLSTMEITSKEGNDDAASDAEEETNRRKKMGKMKSNPLMKQDLPAGALPFELPRAERVLQFVRNADVRTGVRYLALREQKWRKMMELKAPDAAGQKQTVTGGKPGSSAQQNQKPVSKGTVGDQQPSSTSAAAASSASSAAAAAPKAGGPGTTGTAAPADARKVGSFSLASFAAARKRAQQ
ncbi:unnamed protein product [Amoebophrya sp. A120]|nr:unnamed protein product [Amoebophrya sp. A120]|eukprot:GSA120T00005643001.1